ncbi:UNVERIFIED_CONTAM: Methyltransferase-like protein 2 [Sesamum calycinum]|uniref:Methyltransferase-like protein 2 n=1 Tax=Sesamum calycinum TaxID=2727403 RepID=A0AAW2QMK7_9LAMI
MATSSESDDRLSAFLKSGIYRFDNANAFFVDPVRVLNRCYTRFRVSPSAYYSRFFPSSNFPTEIDNNVPNNSGKRKRREKEKKNSQALNLREQMADRRHQEVRLALLKAHEALLGACQVLETLRNLRDDGEERGGDSVLRENELDFVELGSVWQAPFYEIVLKVNEDEAAAENAGGESYYQKVVTLFENHVANEASNDVEAELLDHKQIHNLIPAESDCGFNLILIDPPWENSSAHQKLKYRTLPNWYFLSLPIKQLTHTAGALVALWVKADGSLISELDLFHHRPYECLLLGFSHGKEMNSEQLLRPNHIPDNQVFISVPGDYSRKPPIGEILLDYVPGFKPARCIELFSREMIAGWTSWVSSRIPMKSSILGQDIFESLLYANSAGELWLELEGRLDQCSWPLQYQLQREIFTISEGDGGKPQLDVKPLYCDNCDKTGHTCETCFKLHHMKDADSWMKDSGA